MASVIERGWAYLAARGTADAARFVFSSTMQLCRGLAHGYWLVFIGAGVKIRSRKNVRIGRMTRIEDYCELDGFGTEGITIGSNAKIGKFSIVRVPPVPHVKGAGIEIGEGTTFAEFCFIGGAGAVRIGAYNAFGQYVSIHPQNHLPHQAGEPVKTTNSGIAIGDRNWFGAKSTVLDGVQIADCCVVAAGAVIRGAFPSASLVAGVPAVLKRAL